MLAMNREAANAVVNFANSAGCNRTGPSSNHDRDPAIGRATTIVTSNNTIITAYKAYAKVSYAL